MPIRVKTWDVTRPGQRTGAAELIFDTRQVTARELIEARVKSEVARFNASSPLVTALIEVGEAERLLNGERQKRTADQTVQVERALRAFQSNGFLVFVDGTQLIDLEQSVELGLEPEVEFLKLVPLVGG